MRTITTLLLVIGLAVAVSPALAEKGGIGNGRGPQDRAAGSCTVAGDVLEAAGLPTDDVVNFLVSDATGTRGWVLGFTDDGRWSMSVPAHDGVATYEFVSRTWGPNGSKYEVFASCSA